MVNGGRVFYDHKIEPPASTSSSSCNTDFTADTLKVITNFLYSGQWHHLLTEPVLNSAMSRDLTFNCSVGNGPAPTLVV